MSLLVLKKDFTQRRGHPWVILPFVGWEIPQDSPCSSFPTKLLFLSPGSKRNMIQFGLLSIISTYISYHYLRGRSLPQLALSDTSRVSGFPMGLLQQAADRKDDVFSSLRATSFCFFSSIQYTWKNICIHLEMKGVRVTPDRKETKTSWAEGGIKAPYKWRETVGDTLTVHRHGWHESPPKSEAKSSQPPPTPPPVVGCSIDHNPLLLSYFRQTKLKLKVHLKSMFPNNGFCYFR